MSAGIRAGNRHRCDWREQERFAVGRGGLDRQHAEAALSACAVFDNDRQVEGDAQVLGKHSGEHVAGPASGEREDDADRLCTDQGSGRQRKDGQGNACEQQGAHPMLNHHVLRGGGFASER